MRLTDFTALYGAEVIGVAIEERVTAADRTIVSLWLRLGGGHDVSLHGAGAGTGVVARSNRPEVIDLAGSSHLEIADAGGRFGLEAGRVVRVWEVHAAGRSVGVRWQLAYGPDVIACFVDDAWTVGPVHEPPGPALEALGERTFTVLYDENA